MKKKESIILGTILILVTKHISFSVSTKEIIKLIYRDYGKNIAKKLTVRGKWYSTVGVQLC